jgi:hypothetical protein
MCAQCHNHPFERFTQADYFGMAAFFARVRVRDGRVFLEPRGELELHGKPVTPPFGSSADRREDLARWVTENDAFARAAANRVWALLMGRPSSPWTTCAPATRRPIGALDSRGLPRCGGSSGRHQIRGLRPHAAGRATRSTRQPSRSRATCCRAISQAARARWDHVAGETLAGCTS